MALLFKIEVEFPTKYFITRKAYTFQTREEVELFRKHAAEIVPGAKIIGGETIYTSTATDAHDDMLYEATRTDLG